MKWRKKIPFLHYYFKFCDTLFWHLKMHFNLSEFKNQPASQREMWGFLNILKTLLFINAWIESTYIVDVLYKTKLFSISCPQIKKLTFVGQICPPPKKAQLPNNISWCIVYNLYITDMHVMNMCILVLQLCCQMHYFSICYLHIVLFEKSVAQKSSFMVFVHYSFQAGIIIHIKLQKP